MSTQSRLVNSINVAASLADVVMPFARVMADPSLSWSQREQISRAVQFCYESWNKMQIGNQAAQMSTAGQQQQSYGIPSGNTPYNQHRVD